MWNSTRPSSYFVLTHNSVIIRTVEILIKLCRKISIERNESTENTAKGEREKTAQRLNLFTFRIRIFLIWRNNIAQLQLHDANSPTGFKFHLAIYSVTTFLSPSLCLAKGLSRYARFFSSARPFLNFLLL